MITHALAFVFLFLSSGPAAGAHPSANGNLTVTAVVASSVFVSFSPDGTPVIVVANAPADAETIVLASTQSHGAPRNSGKAENPAIRKSKGEKHARPR